jgi:hypothetical protein
MDQENWAGGNRLDLEAQPEDEGSGAMGPE